MYPVYINRVLKDLTNRGFEVLYIGRLVHLIMV